MTNFHVGIESMNLYGGRAALNVHELADHRRLEVARFENLLIDEKSVALPCEDPVSFAVNAARPIMDTLGEDDKNKIEMLITCTESGIDFGKSISTYVHKLLGLKANCRLFEIKQACYSGAAGLQTAINFILSQTSPGAKALVITTDISRFALADQQAVQEWAYSEPTSGAGSVAMLISDKPNIFRLDPGAYGNHSFEVMDTCRPGPDTEAGDADLSLMAYLDCCVGAYSDYARRVLDADFKKSFDYLSFHTPFGGMVKGAHRQLMRKLYKSPSNEIEQDFQQRLLPSLSYGRRTGNTAGGGIFVALAGTIDNAIISKPVRIGIFSYGSGCCSEFFSGTTTPEARLELSKMGIQTRLENRYQLKMDEYEALLLGNQTLRFGTKNAKIDLSKIPGIQKAQEPWLILEEVKDYHRNYRWIST